MAVATILRNARESPDLAHFVPLLAALRLRVTALARSRSICPLGRVTQISPIHSSLTPTIGLALKLVRLTTLADFPRSMVFR